MTTFPSLSLQSVTLSIFYLPRSRTYLKTYKNNLFNITQTYCSQIYMLYIIVLLRFCIRLVVALLLILCFFLFVKLFVGIYTSTWGKFYTFKVSLLFTLQLHTHRPNLTSFKKCNRATHAFQKKHSNDT